MLYCVDVSVGNAVYMLKDVFAEFLGPDLQKSADVAEPVIP